MGARSSQEPKLPRVGALLGVAAAAAGATVIAILALAPAALAEAAGSLRLGAGIGLMLGGCALAALGSRRWRAASVLLASAAALLAAASLVTESVVAESPLDMSRSGAVPLLLAATGIALAGARGRARAAEILTGASAALTACFLLGALYAAEDLRSLGGGMPSPLTALGLLLLGVGGLTARPDFALARVLTGRSLGALHLQRALPAVLGIPLAVGLAASFAARRGILDVATAFAAFALLSMWALATATTRHARRLDQLARERARLEGLFRRIFENAAVGIAHLDVEGRWLRVNDRLCEIVGRARDELHHTSIHALAVPTDREATLAACEALAAGAIDSHRSECRFVTKQGHETWVDLVISAERESSGRVEHLVAVVQDISERKQTEADLDLVRRALDCSSDGVLIVSTRRPEGEIVFVNPAFERITGTAAADALGRGWDVLGEPAAEQPPVNELCERMRREDGLSLLLRGQRPGGERYWSQVRLAPVADRRTGAVTHHVGVLEDVTEQLGAVAERERLLGDALSAREDAERAGRAKDEFLALVSHELRSPLGVVASWLPMLRRDERPDLRNRAVTVIHRNVSLLARLIGDLLDASRIVSGKLELERTLVEFAELVCTAVEALQPSAADRGVELHFRADTAEIYVDGDVERLDQIVHNLVENAIKFTPAGGRIDVDVEARDGRVALAVRDTGQGIAAELLPTVFSRFRQGVGGPRGAARGLGLGLGIVRHLAELHGGGAEAESEGPGRGTRVRVELPLASEPRVRVAERARTEAVTLESQCVLLLEPDRLAAEALALALETAEADVAWVRSAGEALAQGDALAPDAIVAAFDALPEESAELVAGMRLPERGLARPPIAVALSTDRTPEARRRARDAGFDAFLQRPFDPAKLAATLRGLLRKELTRVLVVDDDRDAADSLALLLERRGFAVERAYSASDALALALRLELGAVVTDLRLGDGGGVDLARAIRARGPAVRLLAVTGSARGELGPEAAVFDGILQKPVDLAALLDLLRAP